MKQYYYSEYQWEGCQACSGDNSESIMDLIKQCRERQNKSVLKISFTIYQYMDFGQSYFIGTIKTNGKWIRDSYKLYSCLEDSSSQTLYQSQWVERKLTPYTHKKLNANYQAYRLEKVFQRMSWEAVSNKSSFLLWLNSL